MKKVLLAVSLIITTSLSQASEQWRYFTEDDSSPSKSKYLSIETKEMQLTVYRSKYVSPINTYESSGTINQNDNISDIFFHNYKYDCKGNLAVTMKTEVGSKDSKGYMEINTQLVQVKERQITSKGTRYCQKHVVTAKANAYIHNLLKKGEVITIDGIQVPAENYKQSYEKLKARQIREANAL